MLNHLFEGALETSANTYNFMVGMDTVAQITRWILGIGILLLLRRQPRFIHATGDKQWYQINLARSGRTGGFTTD